MEQFGQKGVLEGAVQRSSCSELGQAASSENTEGRQLPSWLASCVASSGDISSLDPKEVENHLQGDSITDFSDLFLVQPFSLHLEQMVWIVYLFKTFIPHLVNGSGHLTVLDETHNRS